MRAWLSPWVIAVTLVGVGLVPRAARAERGVRLYYERGPGAEQCPAEAQLRAAVAARVGHDPFRADGDVAVTCRVVREATALRAVIVLTDESGASRRRELVTPGSDCAGLAAALELTLTLAVAPELDAPFDVVAGPPSAPTSSAPPAQVIAAPAPAVATPIAAIAPAAPIEARVARVDRSQAPRAPATWQLAAAAGVRASLLPGPAASFSVGALGRLGPAWSLEAWLGGAVADSALVPGAGILGVGACRGRDGSAWSLCGGVEAALLDVRDAGVAPTVGLGAGLRWAWPRRGGVTRVGLRLDAGATLVGVRVFTEAAETPAFSSPPWTAAATAWVAWPAGW